MSVFTFIDGQAEPIISAIDEYTTRKPTLKNKDLNMNQITAELNQITAELVTITPDHAAKMLLASKTNNRPISANNVGKIARAMLAGEYVTNGEAVILDTEGNILDGQHRLMACVESGKAFTTVLVSGVDPSAFTTIDTGKARSAGDALATLGARNSMAVAATIQTIAKWRGAGISISGGSATSGSRAVRQRILTNSEVVEWMEQNPGIEDTVARAQAVAPILLSASKVAAILYEAGECEFIAHEFFRSVRDGAGLDAGSPELALVQFLQRAAAMPTGRRYSGNYIMAAAVRALNARLEGRELRKIQAQPTGSTIVPRIVDPNAAKSVAVTA
jgi:hypothetical protein